MIIGEDGVRIEEQRVRIEEDGVGSEEGLRIWE